MTIFLALVIGGLFGFTLDRVGATNPGYIIRMLNLSNLHLLKTIMLAIGTASLLMFVGILVGFVDPGHMSVKDAYIGVFVGGLLLGAGFAIAGYCPGTSVTAAATGRKDALFFVLGGLLGAAAYMLAYSGIKATGLLDKIAGGKATLGMVADTNYPFLIDGLSGEMIGIVLGIVFIAIAALAPAKLSGKD
nr:DUF6691 family protein [uncultured Cohaesibacter sp.]